MKPTPKRSLKSKAGTEDESLSQNPQTDAHQSTKSNNEPSRPLQKNNSLVNNNDHPKNSKSQIFESMYPVLQNKNKKSSPFDDIMNNDPFGPSQDQRKGNKTQRNASRSEKGVPSINSLIDPSNKLAINQKPNMKRKKSEMRDICERLHKGEPHRGQRSIDPFP